MTILLVDDERPAIEALCTAIDWSSLGFEAVRTAYNLEEALKIFAQSSVSVLLCDIEMPGGSGLELLQWVKAHRPDTVCILFTCHADFDYARRAVTLGAFSYLLKPSPMEAVKETVLSAAEEWNRRQEQEKREGQWERNKDVVWERFWLETVMGELPEDQRRLQGAARQRGLELPCDRKYQQVVCTIRRWSGILTGWQAVDLDYVLKNILAELFHFTDETIVLSDSPRRKIILIATEENIAHERLEERCRRFFTLLEERLDSHACFYVGEAVYAEMLAGQQRILQELEHSNISYDDMIFYGSDAAKQEEETEQPPLEQWRELLVQRREQQLCDRVHGWLQKQVRSGHMNAKSMELFYHDFLQMLYTVLAENNISAAQMLQNQREDTKRALLSLENMEEYLGRMVHCSCVYLENLLHKNTLIDQVKAYIEEHLDQELSRDELAGLVFLNANYLSRLFRQETGRSLVDYITHQRIEQIKLLLRTTDASVTEIAGRMGYTNMPYFSRVFRKEEGCTPVEYRRRLRS